MGGRADPQLAEPVSAVVSEMGEESRQLLGVAALSVRFDNFARGGVIRIGSKYRYTLAFESLYAAIRFFMWTSVFLSRISALWLLSSFLRAPNFTRYFLGFADAVRLAFSSDFRFKLINYSQHIKK